MFDFGDELIFESYRIPWLIWIQLLVMFLLILLLYYFSKFALDLSENSATTSSSTGLLSFNNQSHMDKPLPNTTATATAATATATATATTVSSCLHNTKVGEKQSKERDIGTSRRIVRGEGIQELEGEGCSTKDATHVTLSEQSYHLCHYFRLAKQAFLKCFGLDSTSDTSKREQRKD